MQKHSRGLPPNRSAAWRQPPRLNSETLQGPQPQNRRLRDAGRLGKHGRSIRPDLGCGQPCRCHASLCSPQGRNEPFLPATTHLISRVSATAGTVPGKGEVAAVSVDFSVCDDSTARPTPAVARPPLWPRGLSPALHQMMRIPIKSPGFLLKVPCTFGTRNFSRMAAACGQRPCQRHTNALTSERTFGAKRSRGLPPNRSQLQPHGGSLRAKALPTSHQRTHQRAHLRRETQPGASAQPLATSAAWRQPAGKGTCQRRTNALTSERTFGAKHSRGLPPYRSAAWLRPPPGSTQKL